MPRDTASKRFTTAVAALVVALSLLALALGMMRPAEAQLWCPVVGGYDQALQELARQCGTDGVTFMHGDGLFYCGPVKEL